MKALRFIAAFIIGLQFGCSPELVKPPRWYEAQTPDGPVWYTKDAWGHAAQILPYRPSYKR